MTKMNKSTALELIGELANAAANHYAITNKLRRGSASQAAKRELKAAQKLAAALTEEPCSDKELEEALGF